MILLRGLLALVLALAALTTPAQDAEPIDKDSGAALRIALVTISPGAVYWQRFGHNAILVENRITRESALYNFGMFDFEQENFLLNFVRGRMMYRLVAMDTRSDLDGYVADGRSVYVQELDLIPEQRYAVAEMLASNALPENAEYRYDYFFDNCSTRVRDVLDAVLEGGLKQAMQARSQGQTLRQLALSYAQHEPWLALGIDLGLGPLADRKINFHDEMFLPQRLRELARELKVTGPDGQPRPLVREEWRFHAGDLDDTVLPEPDWRWRFAVLGLAMMAILLVLRRRGFPRLAGRLGAVIALLLGSGGLIMAGLWLGTDHAIAARNLNLVLFSPLALLLLPALIRGRGDRFSRAVIALIIALALLGLLYTTLPGVQQANAAWFLLCLPLQIGLLLLMWPGQRLN